MMKALIFICFALLTNTASSVLSHYGSQFHIGLLKNYKGRTKAAWLEVTAADSNESSVPFIVNYARTSVRGTAITLQNPARIDLPLSLISKHIFQRHNGIQISTVNEDQKISVKVYNWIDGTVGSYIALPDHDLSIEKYEYYLISTGNIQQRVPVWSQALIVGTQDNTTVTITSSKNINLPYNLQSPLYFYIRLVAGKSHTFTIHKMQTLYFGKPDEDITGTHIESTKPLTVISGHECGNVPENLKWCEHLTQQIPPTVTWGKRFLLSPFHNKSSGQYYKIVSSENNTQINQTCNSNIGTTHSLTTRGKSISIFGNSSTYCYISSNKPILVAQLAVGSIQDSVGDPIMLLVQPIEQYSMNFYFNVLSTKSFENSYINVVATPSSNVIIDGKIANISWQNIYSSDKSAIIGYGCNLIVSEGVHSVDIVNGTGSVMLYGFNASPQRGYGFPTSVRLAPINADFIVQFDQLKYTAKENSTIVLRMKRRFIFRKLTVYLHATSVTADRTDYQLIDEVISFDIGENEKDIRVAITDDPVTEPNEYFVISIFSKDNHWLFNSTILITDDDDTAVGFIDSLAINDDITQCSVTVALVSGVIQSMTTAQIMLNLTIHQDGQRYTSSNILSFNSHVTRSQLYLNLSRIALNHNIKSESLISARLSPASTNGGMNIRFINQSIFYSLTSNIATSTSLPQIIDLTTTLISHQSTSVVAISTNYMSSTSSTPLGTIGSSIDATISKSFPTILVTAVYSDNYSKSLQFASIVTATAVIIFFIILLIVVILIALVIMKKKHLQFTNTKESNQSASSRTFSVVSDDNKTI